MIFTKRHKINTVFKLVLLFIVAGCGTDPTRSKCEDPSNQVQTTNQTKKTPRNLEQKPALIANSVEIPTIKFQQAYPDLLDDKKLSDLGVFSLLELNSIGREIDSFYKTHQKNLNSDVAFLLNQIVDPTIFEGQGMAAALIAKFKKDHNTASNAWKILKGKSKIANWTSMRKLAFSKYSSDPKNRITGLLLDAASMFEYLFQEKLLTTIELESFEQRLTQNQKTVFKVLCIYMNLLSQKAETLSEIDDGKEYTEFKNLKLVHIDEIPNSVYTSPLLKDFGLRFDQKILYPNIGYVYGGQSINGVCRGLDCSSLVSDIFDLQYRVTTALIAKAATKQIQLPNEISKPSKKLQTYPSLLSELHDKFETLMTPTSKKLALSELQLGDILNWNASYGGNRSHVVFFVKQLTKNSCVVFEATRSDDKDFEGILFRELHTSKDPLQFVLRPKL